MTAQGRQFPFDVGPASGATGLAVRFRMPMAVERITVQTEGAEFWGSARRGRILLIRPEGTEALAGVASGAHPTIDIDCRDLVTQRLEIVPVLSRPASAPVAPVPAAPSMVPPTVLIYACPAPDRDLALGLERCAHAVLARTERDRCFSCHLVAPLAMTAWRASSMGVDVPGPALASLAWRVAADQQVDGSFAYTRATHYPPVSSTLVGALVLAVGRRFDPRLATPLASAAAWLIERQGPDGTLVPDYQVDPLMAGRGFAAFVLAMALHETMVHLRTYGGMADARILVALAAAQSWFTNPTHVGLDKAVFGLLAVPHGGGLARGERDHAIAELKRELSALDVQRYPDKLALMLGILDEFDPETMFLVRDSRRWIPGDLRALPAGDLLLEPQRFRQAIWSIYGSLQNRPW